MGAIGGPNIIEDGLVLSLDAASPRSYPGSGTTWYDLSGNGNNGTLINGISFSSGSLVFDGVSDYVEVDYLSNIVGSTPSGITFEFFAKFNSTDYYEGVMGTYNGPAGTGFALKNYNGKLEFRSYASNFIADSVTSIPVGEFIHGVGVWSSQGNYSIWMNGNKKRSSSANTTWSFSQKLRIGDIYGGMGNPGEFNGPISCVKIYNRALTDAEILQNYNVTKNRFGL